MCRYCSHRNSRIILPDALSKYITAHARHLQVRKNQVIDILRHHSQCGFPAFCRFCLEAEDFQLIQKQQSVDRSEEHTSELQSPCNLVCRLLLEKKKVNLQPRPREPTAYASVQLTFLE